MIPTQTTAAARAQLQQAVSTLPLLPTLRVMTPPVAFLPWIDVRFDRPLSEAEQERLATRAQVVSQTLNTSYVLAPLDAPAEEPPAAVAALYADWEEATRRRWIARAWAQLDSIANAGWTDVNAARLDEYPKLVRGGLLEKREMPAPAGQPPIRQVRITAAGREALGLSPRPAVEDTTEAEAVVVEPAPAEVAAPAAPIASPKVYQSKVLRDAADHQIEKLVAEGWTIALRQFVVVGDVVQFCVHFERWVDAVPGDDELTRRAEALDELIDEARKIIHAGPIEIIFDEPEEVELTYAEALAQGIRGEELRRIADAAVMRAGKAAYDRRRAEIDAQYPTFAAFPRSEASTND